MRETEHRGAAARIAAAFLLAGAALAGSPVQAQVTAVSESANVHAGGIEVPINRSQIIRIDRPYSQALIGNAEIADVLPLTSQSLYVLGKKMGTTSLTLYDRYKTLIAVMDVSVGPDVITLRRQLSELLPKEQVAARISNDAVILTGVLSSSVAVKRAVEVAETYSPGKVVNMLSVGSSQQVMLEVRFSEMKRGAGKDLGIRGIFASDSGQVKGAWGSGAGGTVGGNVDPGVGSIVDAFGIITGAFGLGNLNIQAALDASERKGLTTTLAEPTLVTLSGETASFLAGGEFPIPVLQGNTTSTTNGNIGNVTVEFKPFGVSLAFTPTVLEDGIINLVVAPEVSSIDPSSSVTINGLVIPGLQTRRAKATVELRDGESFALAGLLRRDFQDTVNQFPVLGSIPIIGTLFRSTNFRKEDTELVIIVTPRLVKPIRNAAVKLPTDRVTPPEELDLFLNGRTDPSVSPNPANPLEPGAPAKWPIGQAPSGVDGDHGHVLE